MNFYDIIESFAAKTPKSTASKSASKSATPTTQAKTATPTTQTKTATPVTTATQAKSTKTVTRSTPAKSTKTVTPPVSSSLISGAQKLTTVVAGSIALDNIVDEIVDKEDGIYGSRRSGETIEQLQQLIQPQTVVTGVSKSPATSVIQDAKSCDRVEDKNLEFRKPYLFMLKPPNDIMKNNEYNYRLISNVFLNNDNLNTNNKRYLYLFGLFPCKYIPSAYIPLNRKKLLENTKRLDVKDSDITNVYTNKNEFIKQFHNKIKQFTNTNTIYNNLNLSIFGIILIIYWSIVLLFLNYVMLYYYRNSFNNILVAILFILLIFSIVWKMIYTVQN